MAENKKVAITYTARDFASIKQALVEHAKRYYPDKFQDFNEAGFGSLVLDSAAYIGDILSFYLDYQANESFLQTATERANVLKIAQQMGYKNDNTIASTGIASFYIYAPANEDGVEPDLRYVPVLKKGSTVSSTNGVQFILEEDVRFDKSTNEIAVARINETTGIPSYFAIKSYGRVVSGRYVNTTIGVGAFSKFLRVEVPVQNVIEIVSVTDSEGFEYYEVENLSQDYVYKPVVNRTGSKKEVQSFLRPFFVPRRYVIENENNSTFLQFGHGFDETKTMDTSIADPSGVVLKTLTKDYISDTSFDPNRLVYNDKFGIVPVNTTLSIVARVNDSERVNASSNTLTELNNIILEFEDVNNLDGNVVSFIRASLEVNNEEAIIGSFIDTTTQDIKKIAMSSMSSQNRAVTKQDYVSLIYRMPKKFGAVKRANVLRDQNSFKRNLNVYIISQDTAGKLSTSPLALKQNIKTWLNSNKMINDTIDILDAKIVNLSISFQVVSDLTLSKERTLAACLTNLKNFYTRVPDIGESFFINDVFKVLRDTKGVLDVVSVKINNKTGGSYSSTVFDLDSRKSVDGRLIEMPDNVIYEIKYPNEDIKGAVV